MPRMKKNDKRDRLVVAADKLIYEKTFHTTTLADIAILADVPLGNVYYYFKTKESIVDAVLEKRKREWYTLFQQWEQIADVKQRLCSLLQHNASHAEDLAHFGCAIGNLCQELGKQKRTLSQIANKLMLELRDWIEKQFRILGQAERAPQLATYLLSGIQGMNLLTLSFKEPRYIEIQTAVLNEWLATL